MLTFKGLLKVGCLVSQCFNVAFVQTRGLFASGGGVTTVGLWGLPSELVLFLR